MDIVDFDTPLLPELPAAGPAANDDTPDDGLRLIG